MRIGLDYRPALDARSGIGIYVRELAAALAARPGEDELELFGHRLRQPRGAANAPVPAGARLHRRRVPATVLDLAGRAGLGADRLLGSVDVLHATDYAPLHASDAPLVATIHDVCFHTLPDCYPAGLRDRLAAVTDALVARAARIIVPTLRVRSELLQHTAAAEDEVRVVPHGAPALPPSDRLPQAPARYVLAVGTIQPRKNVGRLLEAFARVHARDPGLVLVVVGAPGWGSDAVLDRLAHQAGVRHVADAGRAELAGWLRGARALLYPSLGEGFGFPVLEGWQAGVPVLTGGGTSAGDIGGDAVLPVDPRDVDDLATAIEHLVQDERLREVLIAGGRARLEQFTWQRTAEATRAVYAEVADA